MNDITKKMYVVVTKRMGIFYVDESQAGKIISIINSNNPPKGFKIEDSFVETSDIAGVDPAWRYEENKRIKNGDWKCTQGKWHSKFDQCKCNWGMDTTNTKSLVEDVVTEEQLERGSIIRKLIKKKYKLKGLAQKTNQELREILSSL